MSQSSSHSSRLRLGVFSTLLLASLLMRGGVLAWRFAGLQQDPDAYRLLAENLANHGIYGNVDDQGNASSTAFRPPGYPWLLSWLVFDAELSSLTVAGLHYVLGLMTIWLAFRIGCLLRDATVGLVAAIIVAIDPILLGQSTLVMTETVATLIAALAWWMFVKADRRLVVGHPASIAGWSLGLGAVLAGGFLCRPIFVVWATLAIGMLLVIGLFRNRRTWLVASCVATVMLIVVSCWTLRNLNVMSKPIWATSHGGYTLLLGNNPSFYAYLRDGSFGEKWDAEFFHNRWAMRKYGDPTKIEFWTAESIDHVEESEPLSEVADDRLAYETARAAIDREPQMFAISIVVRLGRLWSPMPHAGDVANVIRYSIGLYYLALFVVCLFGTARLGRELLMPRWLMMILLAVALSGVHSLYWSNMRMRCLATPLLATLAATAITGAHRQIEVEDKNDV